MVRMKRFVVKNFKDNAKKYFYIQDNETYDIVPLPSKYLKYLIETNQSPKTVLRRARSLSYYMEYLAENELMIEAVCDLAYEEQNKHFVQFLWWLKEGRHTENNKINDTGNGTCNAYLKDVFRFFLYAIDCGYYPPLKVLKYNQIAVANAVGVKRTMRFKSFNGYLKPKERNVRAAEEDEVIDILQCCTNTRDQLLLLMLAETGFRIGELLGVDYTRDINYQNHTISVYFRDDNENDARAKNAEYRHAKISDETFDFLLHYMSEYRKLLQHQTMLFINIAGKTAGKPLREESVRDMLKRMEKKTGVKLTPHMLRRYFAQTRRQAGWKLELISQALGHKHLDTTIKYLGIIDDQLIEASRDFYAKHSDTYRIKELL